MLDYIIERTNIYIDDMPKKERKKYGQFFTSKETARFMAGLYTIPENLSEGSHFRRRSRFRHIGVCAFGTIGADRFCSDDIKKKNQRIACYEMMTIFWDC